MDEVKFFTFHEGRGVIQMSLNGDKIKEYPSIIEASRNVPTTQDTIQKACEGICKTAGGFTWKYKEEKYNVERRRNLKIKQIKKVYNKIKKNEEYGYVARNNKSALSRRLKMDYKELSKIINILLNNYLIFEENVYYRVTKQGMTEI